MAEMSLYCDESCHLQHDRQCAMVLGCLWCASDQVNRVSSALKALRRAHGLDPNVEIKWTRVSPSKIGFYLDLCRIFLDDPALHFRGVVVPDKTVLRHEEFGQSHDDWYYKMYYTLLKPVTDLGVPCRIYLDIKDTNSSEKVERLGRILKVAQRSNVKDTIRTLQVLRSHEVQLLQLADFLIGAVSYEARKLESSDAKLSIVRALSTGLGLSLAETTPLSRRKFNILRWRPRGNAE